MASDSRLRCEHADTVYRRLAATCNLCSNPFRPSERATCRVVRTARTGIEALGYPVGFALARRCRARARTSPAVVAGCQ